MSRFCLHSQHPTPARNQECCRGKACMPWGSASLQQHAFLLASDKAIELAVRLASLYHVAKRQRVTWADMWTHA